MIQDVRLGLKCLAYGMAALIGLILVAQMLRMCGKCIARRKTRKALVAGDAIIDP
jgi:hypothetical protein